MMQVGNLAIVAAKHKDCMLQIYDNQVSVHAGRGNEKRTLTKTLLTELQLSIGMLVPMKLMW